MTNTTQWWRGNVIYQIYPRSFQDDNGDGIGDIKGITRRLPHIKDLGADTIWLSPFFTSPMKDMGYDVSDYTDVDPQFGTIKDFEEMTARAHDLGLKVMIDQVLSHSSDQHEFFKESRASRDNPKADWYVWADPNPDGSPPNNWPAVFGGPAWEWESRRQQYYLHNFLIEQPDFNFHNQDVQDWHLENMRFWLELGVDGFRLDTVNFYVHDEKLRDNPKDPNGRKHYLNTYDMQEHIYSKNRPENIPFLEKMRKLCDKYDAAMVGEVGDSHAAVKIMGEYTKGDGRLHMAYSFEFLGPDFTPKHFRTTIENFFKGAPDGWPCWAFSNHDVWRHVSRWAETGFEDLVAKQSAALLLALQGTICIYQGEEMGQLETVMEYHELTDPPGIRFWPENTGRDGCRTPMVWNAKDAFGGFSKVKPWLPVKAPQLERAVDTQGEDSVMALYRDMLTFRNASDALKSAPMKFIDVPDPFLAFRRDDLICVYNLSNTKQSLEVKGAQASAAPSQNVTVTASAIEFGAHGFVILQAGEI